MADKSESRQAPEVEAPQSMSKSKSEPLDRVGWVAPEDYPAEQRESVSSAPGWAEQDAASSQGTEAPKTAPSAPRAAPESSGSSRTSGKS